MTMDGMLLEDISATDINSRVELRIAKGTHVTNRVGQKVNSIRITPNEQSFVVGSYSSAISLSYSIGPSGTTFDPAATLIFKFADSELPGGISANSLYIAQWDPDTGEWIDFGGEIDPAAHTVSVPVQHLSTYALIVRTRPAAFDLSGLALSSAEVGPGESLTASVLVTNAGDRTGSYKASLKLDDAVVATETVTLDGQDSETVSFDIVATTAGEHRASIGDLSATFVVSEVPASAAFITSDLAVSPAEINPGDSIDISVLVSNTSNISGTYRVVLRIDNTEVQARILELAGGQSRVVGFNVTPEAVGYHVVTVGSQRAAYFVLAPPVMTEESVTPTVATSSFTAAPVYDPETGKLISTRIEYQLDGLPEQLAETSLILKVFYEGEPLEEIPLLTLTQLQPDGYAGSLEYVPSDGWKAGLYFFQAELYEGENSVWGTELQELTVTPQDVATVVSWKILGIIIGIVLIVTVILLAAVVIRRREMLRS
jgi:hypothetical protein